MRQVVIGCTGTLRANSEGTSGVRPWAQGKLVTNVRGTEVGTISDAKLCEVLFDIYLGKDPSVPGAKSSLGEQLAGHVTR
jgi:hypothetical protein